MMTELGSSLTVTGVIATMISVIFAGASFAISHRRRTHHQALARQGATPTPAHHIPQNLKPDAAPTLRMPVAHASEAVPLTPVETRATSSPLFKRLGRAGVEHATGGGDEAAKDNQLSWE